MRWSLLLFAFLLGCPAGYWPDDPKLGDVLVGIPTGDGGPAPSDSGVVDESTPDAGVLDTGTDAGALDAGSDAGDRNEPVCGDLVVEGSEQCDDGLTADCTGSHDGGDGVCVPLGTCSAGFDLVVDVCEVASEARYVVNIFVSNFCEMSLDPVEITIPDGQTAYFDWRNRSADYPVDVWMSYGGGFLDLPTGQTWEEPISHCLGPNARTEFADISAGGCAEQRFLIHCLGE